MRVWQRTSVHPESRMADFFHQYTHGPISSIQCNGSQSRHCIYPVDQPTFRCARPGNVRRMFQRPHRDKEMSVRVLRPANRRSYCCELLSKRGRSFICELSFTLLLYDIAVLRRILLSLHILLRTSSYGLRCGLFSFPGNVGV